MQENSNKRYGPKQVVLKLTNGCNLNCVYCFSNAGEHNKVVYMESQTVLDFFDQYFEECKNPFVNCTFHGGEPLTNVETLEDIINQLKVRYYYPRIDFTIQSNGTLISSKNIDFLKRNFSSIGLSLDGIGLVQQKTRPKFNGDNSFIEFERGVDILRANNIPCGILIIVTKHNIDHLLDTLNWCVSKGITSVSIELMFPNGRASDKRDMSVTPDEYFNAMKEILYWQIDYNISNKNPFHIREFTTLTEKIAFNNKGHMCAGIPCGAGKDEISLCYDGSVYACDSFDGMPEYVLGNINKDKLVDMLNSPIVERLTSRTLKGTECDACNQKNICIFGCPLRNLYNEDNNMFGRIHLCNYYKKISRLLYELLVKEKMDPSLFTVVKGRTCNFQIINFI